MLLVLLFCKDYGCQLTTLNPLIAVSVDPLYLIHLRRGLIDGVVNVGLQVVVLGHLTPKILGEKLQVCFLIPDILHFNDGLFDLSQHI